MTTTIKCGGVAYSIHEAANVFPLLGSAELKELADDIKKRGLQELIARDKAGLVYDGRNRLMACDKAGVQPRFVEVVVDDPVAYVISRNIRRRHLTAAQKRDAIKKLLKLTPHASDRQVATQTNASPTTVGAVRKKAEAKGEVSKVETRKDTKGRRVQSGHVKPKTPSLMLVEAVKAKAKADEGTVDAPVVKAKPGTVAPASTVALSNFIYACNTWLPKLDTADRGTATTHFQKTMSRLNGQAEISVEEHQAEMAKLAETAGVSDERAN